MQWRWPVQAVSQGPAELTRGSVPKVQPQDCYLALKAGQKPQLAVPRRQRMKGKTEAAYSPEEQFFLPVLRNPILYLAPQLCAP